MKKLYEILGVKKDSRIEVSQAYLCRSYTVGEEFLHTMLGTRDYETTACLLLGNYKYRKEYEPEILILLNDAEQLHPEADFIIISLNKKYAYVFCEGSNMPIGKYDLGGMPECPSGRYYTSKYKIPWRMVVIDGFREVE